MAVSAGSFHAILTGGIAGNNGTDDPLPSSEEGVTRGHWDGLGAPTLPPPPPPGQGVGNLAPIELLYPMVPKHTRNKLLFRTDNKNWVGVQKSINRWGHEFITLKYRIHKAVYMDTFYKFLEDNAGKIITLDTPGVQPFMRATESNEAYIKKFTRPKREKQKTWRIDVTFLHNPN